MREGFHKNIGSESNRYIIARLDGAAIGFFHVLQNCPLDQVRIGMRVRAKWVSDDKLAPTVASIEYFEPIDEPDVPYEKIKENT